MPTDPLEDQRRVGANVRRLRKRRGMSQWDLAWEAGLHPTAIGRLERGEHEPRLHTITTVARAFEVAPSKLLAGL